MIDGVPIQAPKLKGHVPPDAQRVYVGFLQLLSLKWLVTANAPSPLSWRFAQEWLGGMSQTAVARAIGWLLGRGYLRVVEMWGKLGLFLFGTRALINRRRHKRHVPESAQTTIVEEVAKDVDEMLTPEERACPDCGADRASINPWGCHWCIAIEAQQRMMRRRRSTSRRPWLPDSPQHGTGRPIADDSYGDQLHYTCTWCARSRPPVRERKAMTYAHDHLSTP